MKIEREERGAQTSYYKDWRNRHYRQAGDGYPSITILTLPYHGYPYITIINRDDFILLICPKTPELGKSPSKFSGAQFIGSIGCLIKKLLLSPPQYSNLFGHDKTNQPVNR